MIVVGKVRVVGGLERGLMGINTLYIYDLSVIKKKYYFPLIRVGYTLG